MANPTIDLLFKVAGGADLNTGSGREIKRDIDAIVNAIQNDGTTDLYFKVSQKSLENIRADIKKCVQNIQVTFDGKQTGSNGSGAQSSGGGKYLSTEASQLHKLVSLYKDYNSLRIKAAKAPDGSKEQAALQELANDRLREARQLRKDYNLDGKRTAAINNQIKESYLRTADALSLIKAKQEDIKNTPLTDASQLQAMERQLLSFQREFDNVSKQGFLKPGELASFQSQFNSIWQRFHDIAGKASEFDTTFQKFNKSTMATMLADINNLKAELRNVNMEAGQFIQDTIKGQNSFNKLANRAQDYYARIESTLARNPAKMRELQLLIDRLHNADFGSITEGSAAFQKLQYEIKSAGLETESLFQSISRIFKTRFGYIISSYAAMEVLRGLRQIYQNVVDIDTKMTELQIVSGETGSAIVRYFDDAAEAAKRVASSITDIVDAMTVYRRLGFDMNKSLDFAELTTMYSKVGNVDMSDAESNITAIIKAFNLDNADKLRQAMDKLVAVGNNYAISSSELGEGLNNAASSLVASGNSFEQSLALLTAANTITQD